MTEAPPGDEPDRILRLKAVLAMTGLSRTTLYRRIALGRFPRPVRISERCAGWRASAVRTWMRDPSGYRAGSAW